MTSHNSAPLCTATFDNVSVTTSGAAADADAGSPDGDPDARSADSDADPVVTRTATPTPGATDGDVYAERTPTRTPTAAPLTWTNKDVGITSPAGSGTQSSGVFTVTGAGKDIWYASDQFHFFYQGLTGDGQIVARATSVQDINAWSKVGVMIRSDLTVNAPYAFMLVTPENGVASQHRLASGVNAAGPTVTGVTVPVWLKLVRSGNDFTTSWSTDGTTWSVVDTVTIPMAQNVLIGLAVTSHSFLPALHRHLRQRERHLVGAAADGDVDAEPDSDAHADRRSADLDEQGRRDHDAGGERDAVERSLHGDGGGQGHLVCVGPVPLLVPGADRRRADRGAGDERAGHQSLVEGRGDDSERSDGERAVRLHAGDAGERSGVAASAGVGSERGGTDGDGRDGAGVAEAREERQRLHDVLVDRWPRRGRSWTR